MPATHVLALDQGTTSSRSIIFDAEGRIVAQVNEEFPQIYPRPGWVEHDPREIWASQRRTAEEALRRAKLGPADIAAIGITNQRETTLIWDRETGEPIHNAIVWQCRRSQPECERLKREGLVAEIRKRTGLVIDAYFSGTKVRWILDHVDGARARAERGELCFGTVDSWLLYQLTGQHLTEASNASRTMLWNIHEGEWDEALLEALAIPRAILPEVKPSSGVLATTAEFGGEIPIAGVAGDQQAALFGQTAFRAGEAKNTYGTGCFALMNTGASAVTPPLGLLTTVAWEIDGQREYALEGSVFIAGAAIQWLRDELGIIDSAEESEALARQVEDTGGVHLVPAFAGLGAPHWNMGARGALVGLTRGTNRCHIARAAIESMSFQTAEVIETMRGALGRDLPSLRVDGGAARNDLLLQHQADLLGVPVVRGQILETTGLGAAFLAGLAVGVWRDWAQLRELWREDRVFEPNWDGERRELARRGWQRAIAAVKAHAHD